MDQMQNEAMDRLRQMYSKTRQQQPQVDMTKQPQKSASIPLTKEQHEEKSEIDTNRHNRSNNLLDVFMQDKEKSLVMLLIVILISEKADSTLILALMYLIL